MGCFVRVLHPSVRVYWACLSKGQFDVGCCEWHKAFSPFSQWIQIYGNMKRDFWHDRNAILIGFIQIQHMAADL